MSLVDKMRAALALQPDPSKGMIGMAGYSPEQPLVPVTDEQEIVDVVDGKITLYFTVPEANYAKILDKIMIDIENMFISNYELPDSVDYDYAEWDLVE